MFTLINRYFALDYDKLISPFKNQKSIVGLPQTRVKKI